MSEVATTTQNQESKIETFEVLKLDTLGSDPSYQRYMSMNYVQQLFERWNPKACGPLLISRRKTGGNFVVDGQHRLETLKMRGETEVMARVFHGLTRQEEAEIRLDTQFVKSERAWERFKAHLASGDPTAKKILKLVQSVGATVQLEQSVPKDQEGVLRSVRSIENVYALDDGFTLTTLLNTIQRIHGSITRDNSQGIYLRGIAWFIYKHPEADQKELEKVLKNEWAAISTRARSTGSPFVSGTLWTNIYKQIVISYNTATKSKLKADVKGSTVAMGKVIYAKKMIPPKAAGTPATSK